MFYTREMQVTDPGAFEANQVQLNMSDTHSSRLVGTDDQRSKGLSVQTY